ncbi:hypothetical protein N9194_01725 [bacterium]|nr:hypothetical protein [bacterium]
MSGTQFEKEVNMVGHNHEGVEVVAVLVELEESVCDDLRDSWIAEAAGAVGVIEDFLEFECKATIECDLVF